MPRDATPIGRLATTTVTVAAGLVQRWPLSALFLSEKRHDQLAVLLATRGRAAERTPSPQAAVRTTAGVRLTREQLWVIQTARYAFGQLCSPVRSILIFMAALGLEQTCC